MIHDFIAYLCDVLQIPVPTIHYTDDEMLSGTMLAMLTKNGFEMALKETEPNITYLFSIAHEIRHAWQIVYHEQEYLSDYKTRDKCASVEEYLLQSAEIDANAFASVAISSMFPIDIAFEHAPGIVVQKIREREIEISDLFG